jgi:predicted 3-demethylubiquinone-9 3-methyltransferase (glyoxalase superfamily)
VGTIIWSVVMQLRSPNKPRRNPGGLSGTIMHQGMSIRPRAKRLADSHGYSSVTDSIGSAAMSSIQRITPCLWFDDQAEEAVAFYLSIFANSTIISLSRYGEAGHEVHGRPPGSVMAVAFELDGQAFTALNGGPVFTFNEAISLQVNCQTQVEVDHYWDKLSAGGDPAAQQCGWLKDRYGLSWQIVPSVLPQLLGDPDTRKTQRVMTALLQMRKLDIAELQQAYAG